MHDQHCRVWNQRFQLRARSTVELVCGGLREKQLPVPLTWSFDLCRGSTNQTYGGRAFLSLSLSFSLSLFPSLSLSISLSLEQRLTFGQGALSWDRKDWSKKRVFVLRKFIYFTLKIKCLFFFLQIRNAHCEIWGKRRFYSYWCFWSIPQNRPSYFIP